MCPHELRVLYDADEGFTIIGKPEEEAFIQQVKETLTSKDGKDPEHFKRVLIAQDPEEPKVYCMVVQHQRQDNNDAHSEHSS